MTAKKRSDNVDRAAIKAFNTVKEDLTEEEECKGEEDELINKRRRDHALKDNIELFEITFCLVGAGCVFISPP
jgi:hypothetical protein